MWNKNFFTRQYPKDVYVSFNNILQVQILQNVEQALVVAPNTNDNTNDVRNILREMIQTHGGPFELSAKQVLRSKSSRISSFVLKFKSVLYLGTIVL